MITRALLKDAFREVRRSPARFFSILAIVAIGAGLFVGIKAAAPDMKYTADRYYDQQNMMDVRVVSTLGLVTDDLNAISATEGVQTVQPAYIVDVTTTVDGVEYVFRVHSLPPIGPSAGESMPVNQPKLVSGRLPAAPYECVIEANRNLPFPRGIGDTIEVSSGTTTDISATLVHRYYRIVGTVVSPLYLTFDHGESSVGGGRVNLFMLVEPSEFLYPVYTEALVTVQGARALDSYSPDYKTLVSRVVGRLQNLGEERAPLRLADIKGQAQAKLDEAKQQLAEERARYDKEIGDAEAKLAKAKDQIVSGQAALDAQREAFTTQVASSEAMIRQFEGQLARSQALFDSSTSGYHKILSQVSTIVSGAKQVKSQAQQALDGADASISAIRGMLDDDNLTDEQKASLESILNRQEDIKHQSRLAIDAASRVTSAANKQIGKAKSQLRAAQAQLTAARAQLAAARNRLAAAKAQAAAQFASAQAELDAAQKKYDEGAAELAAKKADGAKQLADGEKKIAAAQDEIDRLNAPTWYVLDRSKLASYAEYASTADRMDAIALLFPVFFFAVAAMVCLTTMTRMIDEQRTSIGAYKALGYGEVPIAFKYVAYAALASLVGGAIGVASGINVFPKVIFDSWAMMYELPPMEQVPQLPLLIGTVLVSILLTSVTAYFSVRSELTAVPATLMRPKAPTAGKVILIERIPSVWRRLSFSQKVTMRNLFRYKKRFFMTVIGVAGCAALLVAGLGLSDSIGSIVGRQYGQILKQDLELRFTPTATDEGRAEVFAALGSDRDVASTLQVSDVNATVKGTTQDYSASLVSPLDAAAFPGFISLRTREGQVPITLPDSGVVITEKLAGDLGLRVGDMIAIDRGTGVYRQAVVSGITENYIFHYVFASPAAFREVFGTSPECTGVLVLTTTQDRDAESQLGTRLMAGGQVASVTYYSDAVDKFQDTIKSLNTIVWAMIISAGLLAFVVLYNLTIINLSERTREIATIKVLGFFNREVSSYIYREITMLTVIGGVFGLGVGVALHRAIMVSIEQENVMFGSYISGWSFVGAFLLTIFFGLVVNAFTYRKLTVVQMVESLKSVE
jgi:putative ABC transport system permease protein